MLEADACQTISLAVTSCMGLANPAEVAASGFFVQSNRCEAAKWMFRGRVLEVSFEGWGVSFEKRTIRIQLAIDLRWDRDRLVQNALQQCERLIQSQISLRARALAQGIGAPLTRDQFTDLTRFQIDIAAARFLRESFSSDKAVTDWLQTELRKVREGTRINEKKPGINTQGLIITVPLLLEPLEFTESVLPLSGRPRWLGDDIDVLCADWPSVDKMYQFIEHALKSAGLHDRPIIYGVPWPPHEWTNAITKWNAKAQSDAKLPQWSQPPDMWRVAIEPSHVSVTEAFS